MKYEDAVRDCKSGKVGIDIAYESIKFEKEGDFLLGIFVERELIQSHNDSDDAFMVFRFVTPDGKRSISLGAYAVTILTEEYYNRIIYIEYKGKKVLKSGRECNQYIIRDCTEGLLNFFESLGIIVKKTSNNVDMVSKVFGGDNVKNEHQADSTEKA